jgi:2-polyprenyl-3-methyl-5-hydroxy-6-metoxy-1,4-benzoquinol methylase
MIDPVAGIATGNAYDKYGSTNPVVKVLMARFESDLAELWARADPQTILDLGCGEGVLTERWAENNPHVTIVGIDLEDAKLREEWERRQRPNLSFRVQEATSLPFVDGEYEMVCAIEVLEHVPDPATTLSEMSRVARRWLLVSVPREPLWRMLNMARGAYWGTLGNTPGHVNHWSVRAFKALVGRYGDVVEARHPFPWTMLLIDMVRTHTQ